MQELTNAAYSGNGTAGTINTEGAPLEFVLHNGQVLTTQSFTGLIKCGTDKRMHVYLDVASSAEFVKAQWCRDMVIHLADGTIHEL